MRVVITGGSGLVGRALVTELSEAGYRCEVLSRSPDRVAGLAPQTAVRRWDGRSVAPLVDLLRGADAVVHLAGEGIADGRWTKIRKERIRDSRVRSSEAVAQAIAQTDPPPAVLAQASAVGYFGPRADEQVNEETPSGSDFLAEVCRAWEAASESVETLGVRRVVLRTGIVLSAEGGALPRMAMPFRFFAGGPVGSGRQWMPWIHISDEVGSIRFLMANKEARGPFNLCAPNPVTNRELSRVLGRVLHRPSLAPAPGFALRLLFGEMADLLLTGQRAIPKRLLELGYPFRFPELEPALRDLLT